MAKQKLNTRPVLADFFTEWRDWWEGFNEAKQSRKPTSEEKQKMLMYPIVTSIIQHKTLPLLAPRIKIDGNEKQVKYLKMWFDRYYRRCMKMMIEQAIVEGFSAGERIINVLHLDNQPLWFQVGSLVADSENITLLFNETEPQLMGFQFDKYVVRRLTDNGDWMMPGMVYMVYEGDEVNRPQGNSILNKLFWAWQLVMKTWTSMTVYQRLHSPFLKYFFVPEMYGDTDNIAQDQGRSQAQSDLKKIKSTQGIAMPMIQDDKGQWVKGPDLEVVAPPDKEPQFNETIRILNSMMYVAVNFPERLSEQFKDTGAYKMVETQKDFYTEYILPDAIENVEYHCREWFTDPMLEVNFGKIDCEYSFMVSDKQKAFLVGVLEKLIQTGQSLGELDVRKIAETAGIPVLETQKPQVETAERKPIIQGIDFSRDAEFASKRAEDKKRLEKWVKKVVAYMNNEIEKIKTDMYNLLKRRLDEQHAKLLTRIEKLYKKGIPKRVDLQKAVQIPSSVYSDIFDYILRGWDSGQRFHCEHANIKPLEKPSSEILEKLKTIRDVFVGSKYLMGEGERLESRLYRVLANVRQEDAISTLNNEMEAYIQQTLPIRIRNLIHEANHYGTKDFAKYIQFVNVREKGGKQ